MSNENAIEKALCNTLAAIAEREKRKLSRKMIMEMH
jgi:hypothetical protein